MGFADEDIDNSIASGMSNAQLYKQAGNSIVVNVLMAIFKKML
jgi:DNA (cytosine-5)-methyltransferase 1